MVRLVEVVLKPGSRACPPLATLAAEPGCLSCALYPGYAGVEGARDLHHSGGRQRVGFLVVTATAAQPNAFKTTAGSADDDREQLADTIAGVIRGGYGVPSVYRPKGDLPSDAVVLKSDDARIQRFTATTCDYSSSQ